MMHKRRFCVPRFPQELISDLRIEAGLTQQQFADAIGCGIATLSRWETSRPPSLEVIFKLLPWAIRRNCMVSAAAMATVLQDELEGQVKLLFWNKPRSSEDEPFEVIG